MSKGGMKLAKARASSYSQPISDRWVLKFFVACLAATGTRL